MTCNSCRSISNRSINHSRMLTNSTILNTESLSEVVIRIGIIRIRLIRQFLHPYNHRIIGILVGSPLSINGRSFRQLTSKCKRCGTGRLFIPSAESVTRTTHCQKVSIRSYITVLDELGSVVGSTLSVFVEHEPVTLLLIHGEVHITLDGNLIAELIQTIRLGVHNVTSCARSFIFHQPTHEVIFRGSGNICSANLIRILRLRSICAEEDVVRTQRCRATIIIRDNVGLEEHCIIIHFSTILKRPVQFSLYLCTDFSNGQGSGSSGIGNRVTGLILNPSKEGHSGGKSASTRVIYNGIVMTTCNISLLNINHNGCVVCNLIAVLIKVQFQTSFLTSLRHNIHGEASGGEGDLAVLGGHRGHKLVAIGTLVIDVHVLTIGEIGVGNGDHHRLASGGLPSLGAILDGDVIGTLHLLALHGSTLHRRHSHLGGRGHLARHRHTRGRNLFGNGTTRGRTLILRHQRRKRNSGCQKQHQSETFQHHLTQSVLVNFFVHRCVYLII